MSHEDPSVFYTLLTGAERDDYIRLQPTSEPLHFEHYQTDPPRPDKRRPPPTVLPLFASIAIPSPPAPHRAHSAPPQPADGEAAAAIFAGGPIWAMDWLPPGSSGSRSSGGHGSRAAFLAIAAHSEGSEESVYGARAAGRSVVQVPRRAPLLSLSLSLSPPLFPFL